TQWMLPGLPAQTKPCTYNNQLPQCRLAVLWGRTPPATSVLNGKTDGRLVTIGGSAGANLAVELALTGTPGSDRSDCAVGLSGNYDFSDVVCLNQYATQGDWLTNVLVYNNIANTSKVPTDPAILAQLLAQSAIALPNLGQAPPIMLVQSVGNGSGSKP